MIKIAIITFAHLCVVIEYEDRLIDSAYVKFRTVTIRKIINSGGKNPLYLGAEKINNSCSHVELCSRMSRHVYNSKTFVVYEDDIFNSAIATFEEWEEIEYAEFEDEDSLTLFMETL